MHGFGKEPVFFSLRVLNWKCRTCSRAIIRLLGSYCRIGFKIAPLLVPGLGVKFCKALEQPVLARFGKLSPTVSTAAHQTAFNGLSFRVPHIGGDAGGNVVVRRMKSVR
jgi:hypothetical protein